MKDQEDKLDGQTLNSSAVMALLEILNGGPEIGRLSVEDRHRLNVTVTRLKGAGKPFVASTAEDMDKNNYPWITNK